MAAFARQAERLHASGEQLGDTLLRFVGLRQGSHGQLRPGVFGEGTSVEGPVPDQATIMWE